MATAQNNPQAVREELERVLSIACCVMAPEEQYGQVGMRLHRGFPVIALFVVRSSRIYCLYCRNRSVDSRQAQTA